MKPYIYLQKRLTENHTWDDRKLVMEALMVLYLSSQEVDSETWVQAQNGAGCISQSANASRKGMNLTILPPAMSK